MKKNCNNQTFGASIEYGLYKVPKVGFSYSRLAQVSLYQALYYEYTLFCLAFAMRTVNIWDTYSLLTGDTTRVSRSRCRRDTQRNAFTSYYNSTFAFQTYRGALRHILIFLKVIKMDLLLFNPCIRFEIIFY
jgi:hypothetical protein